MIELQDKRTWSKELKKSIEKSCNFDKTISKFNIIGYHYTNQLNIRDILKNGIKILDSNVIDIIIDNLCKIYPNKSTLITKEFNKYLKKEKFDNRKKKMFFYSDNKQVNNGFDHIFNYYGGEITYNIFDNQILGTDLLKNIGKPYIIKFVYRYNDMVEWKRKTFKGKITKKYFENKKIDMDLAINKNVPPKKILGFYEVSEKNGCNYYITKFVPNKKFDVESE